MGACEGSCDGGETSGVRPPRCSTSAEGYAAGVRGSARRRALEELGEHDVQQRAGGDDRRRLEVERVHLGPQPRRQAWVLDFLQAGAVDVPDAALRDVS